MMGRGHSHPPTSITTASESPAEELGRRQKRYAVMAAIFVATFTAAALLHRDTALALLLCGVAMATLVLSVIGANGRSPRRAATLGRVVDRRGQLPSTPANRSVPNADCSESGH
jgi:hypothetical protein